MTNEELQAKSEILTNRILPYVGMLLILPSSNAQPEDVIYNGTASFVDTGTHKLLITCGHVIDRFNELRSEKPETVLAVTGISEKQPVLVSDAVVIDNGKKRVDLATLKLPDPDRITWCGKSYFKAETWPPVRPQIGQVAMLAGFPGMHREPSARGLEVRATHICEFVTSVSDRNIILADEEMSRVAVKHNPKLKDLVSLGGMSGSAVYVEDEERQAPQLAGFLYEAGEGTHATIFIAHAAYICADGMLDYTSIPW